MLKNLLIGAIILLLICIILISIALGLTIYGEFVKPNADNDTYKTICYTGSIISGFASLILYGFYLSEKNKFN